jgi:hypothetical protein
MSTFGAFSVVRNTTKNVLGSNGLIGQVAVNTPAFEFNADGSYKGLLVEPGATNLALRSQTFNAAEWTLFLGTIISTTEIAPDGTATATRIRMGAGNAAFLRQSFTIVNGTTLALSLYIKQVSGTTAFLDISDKKSVPDITPTTSWVKYETTTTWNTAFPFIDLEFRGASGVAEVIIWGAQLETGSVATSYIPTVDSTVARTADDISLSSASSLIGQTEGTMYIELLWRSSGAVSQNILYIGDGTANNSIALFRSQSANELRMFINSNGITQTGQGQSSVGYSGIIKIAFAYATNDAVLFKDGVSISSDNTIDLSALATISNVYLGQSEAKALVANMWIRSVALFPTRLSNAQLVSLTTL